MDGQTDRWTDDMQSQCCALHYTALHGKNYCNWSVLVQIIIDDEVAFFDTRCTLLCCITEHITNSEQLHNNMFELEQ